MRRQWLWPVGLAALVALASGALSHWLTHPTPPPPNPVVAEDGEESEPKMSNARYRYLHSQASHWRAVMLKR